MGRLSKRYNTVRKFDEREKSRKITYSLLWRSRTKILEVFRTFGEFGNCRPNQNRIKGWLNNLGVPAKDWLSRGLCWKVLYAYLGPFFLVCKYLCVAFEFYLAQNCVDHLPNLYLLPRTSIRWIGDCHRPRSTFLPIAWGLISRRCKTCWRPILPKCKKSLYHLSITFLIMIVTVTSLVCVVHREIWTLFPCSGNRNLILFFKFMFWHTSIAKLKATNQHKISFWITSHSHLVKINSLGSTLAPYQNHQVQLIPSNAPDDLLYVVAGLETKSLLQTSKVQDATPNFTMYQVDWSAADHCWVCTQKPYASFEKPWLYFPTSEEKPWPKFRGQITKLI